MRVLCPHGQGTVGAADWWRTRYPVPVAVGGMAGCGGGGVVRLRGRDVKYTNRRAVWAVAILAAVGCDRAVSHPPTDPPGRPPAPATAATPPRTAPAGAVRGRV